ncbi:hypothetical protein, partial [Helicobacter rodentium]|uniref:hypothetical protein n=1 Tax=Helicobacter rodentium TaxID=59617 RepID=UPI00262F1B02
LWIATIPLTQNLAMTENKTLCLLDYRLSRFHKWNLAMTQWQTLWLLSLRGANKAKDEAI